jgi:hypothetical protein
MRRLRLTVAATTLCLLLAGCGGGTDLASDPGETSAPEATPTVGTYPAFAPEDYTFTLVVACYCLGGGTPIDVTVRDGEVVDATYDGEGRGVEAGTPVDQSLWLTVDDVIDAANDTGAASVEVVWPAGQAYPDSVFVDRDLDTVDEEVGYQLSQVVLS